jgi:hypothetical protein
MTWVIVGVAIVVAGIVLFVLSRRRAPDPVTSFQRQIDALSPEARRSTADRVQQLQDDAGATDDTGPAAERRPADDQGPGPDGA